MSKFLHDDDVSCSRMRRGALVGAMEREPNVYPGLVAGGCVSTRKGSRCQTSWRPASVRRRRPDRDGRELALSFLADHTINLLANPVGFDGPARCVAAVICERLMMLWTAGPSTDPATWPAMCAQLLG